MLEIIDEKVDAGAVVGGKYRLERVLGEGGMGVVWSAQELASGRRVALKFMRNEAKTDPRSQERFLREARAAMTIAHPNVARVEAALETRGGVPYIVMEYLEGTSLRDELRRRHVLGIAECARIIVAVVDAIAAAHEKRIVHRDLKPENVFLSAVGVRVLDFGIAKQLPREDATPQSLTTTGSLLGTPLYMAPEQLFGDDVDLRVDIWALGVMTYECLAGEPPTAGNGFGPVIKRITTERLVPLEEMRAGLPPSLTMMVGRMLSRDRNLRPSLEEIRAVFAAATSNTDAPPSPLAMSYAGPSATPQHPAMQAPALASKTATIDPKVAFAPTLDPVASTPSLNVATRPPAQPKKRTAVVAIAAAAAVLVFIGGGAALLMSRGKSVVQAPSLPDNGGWSKSLLAASDAFGRRDGAACLRALDEADRLTPPGQVRSTDAKSMTASQRAMCMMLAGECEGGKALYVAYYQANNPTNVGPDMILMMTEGTAAQYCEGDKLSPRDALLRASFQLQQIFAGRQAATIEDCRRLHQTEQTLVKEVRPQNASDPVAFIPMGIEAQFGVCLAHAGACAEAFKVYHDDWMAQHQDYLPADREPAAKIAFNNAVQTTKCTR